MDFPQGTDPQQRLTRLEEALMFQQQHLTELDGVIVALRKQIDALQKQLARQQDTLEGVVHRISEDIPHEKPPHY